MSIYTLLITHNFAYKKETYDLLVTSVNRPLKVTNDNKFISIKDGQNKYRVGQDNRNLVRTLHKVSAKIWAF